MMLNGRNVFDLRPRTMVFCAVGLAFLLSALIFSLPGMRDLEWKLADIWAMQTLRHSISDSVAVIGIDENLFEEEELSWPLDKNVYAEILSWCDTMGARGVAFDLQFTDELYDCGRTD